MGNKPEQREEVPVINYVVSFILVGLAWGLTTPFIRRAARTHDPSLPPRHASLVERQPHWLPRKLLAGLFAAIHLLRNPRYAVPLLLNLTGSVWFFLLIGRAGSYQNPSQILPVHVHPKPTHTYAPSLTYTIHM